MAGIPQAAGTGGVFSAGSHKGFKSQLKKVYTFYTGGFIAFVILLAIAEQMGLPRRWIGYVFLLATVGLYAGIGIMSRTSDAAEYYVAGRRVPALFNGMATGADWMSAASFIGMAGTLYLTGFGGLAFVMGWTGGYCLVALFLAPYLRKFGQFTIPDFLGARYGGHIPRSVGIFAAILCSFTYVVAQIYGVGLITTRLTGVPFELGIFLGLGGILVCSFLGGMRAVTWTQVAQYIILIIAYMIPVIWLSVKQTGIPIPQIVYGKQLEKVTALEEKFLKDPKELEVRGIFKARADEASANLKGLPGLVRRRQGEARRRRREAQGRQRAARAGERRGKGGRRLSQGRRRREGAMDEGFRPAGAGRAPAAPRRGLPRQGRRRARCLAPQLPGARVLSHGRHRRAPAHPDALLHDAVGAAGARVGVLVAVLHLPAVLHGARPGRAGEVRRLLVRRRLGVREVAAVGRRVAGGGSNVAVDHRYQQGRHRAARRDFDRRRHHRACHTRDRGLAVCDLRASWQPAVWPRRCPPRTACC